MHAVAYEEVFSRYIRIQPQQIPGIDHMILRNAIHLSNLVDCPLDVESRLDRAVGLGGENNIVRVRGATLAILDYLLVEDRDDHENHGLGGEGLGLTDEF